jgi:hypothetical protein
MSFSLIPFILISGILFLVTTPIQGENIQPSQSFSNSPAQDQKLASATSSSSSQKNSSNSSQNSTNSSTQNNSQRTETYINQFLPSFKLNYPKEWKMETNTKTSGFYANLLIREIYLKKNNSQLKITLSPIVPTGCSGGPESDYPNQIQVGKFKRYFYETAEKKAYYYSKYTRCDLPNQIKSNIKPKDALPAKNENNTVDTAYFQEFISNETIDFIASFELISNTPQEILESDEIVKNSILE